MLPYKTVKYILSCSCIAFAILRPFNAFGQWVVHHHVSVYFRRSEKVKELRSYKKNLHSVTMLC